LLGLKWDHRVPFSEKTAGLRGRLYSQEIFQSSSLYLLHHQLTFCRMGVDFFRLLQFWNTWGILYRSLLCKTSGFRLLIRAPVIQTDYTETLTQSDHDWNIDHIDFAIRNIAELNRMRWLHLPQATFYP